MEMRDSYSVDMKRDYHEGFIEREKGEEEKYILWSIFL